MTRLALRGAREASHPADTEGHGDGGRPVPSGLHLTYPPNRHRRLAAFIDPLGLLALAASILACCRSRMNLRSISATIPSTVTRQGDPSRNSGISALPPAPGP